MIDYNLYLPATIDQLNPITRIKILDKSYLILHCKWIEVPDSELDNIYNEALKRLVKRDIPKLSQSWKIKGSKGDNYLVKLENGVYSCNCKGFHFNNKCSHIEEAKSLNGPKKFHKVTTASGKTTYNITELNGKYTCSCPSFKKNNKECSHIKEVKRIIL